MEITYDPNADALNITFKKGKVAKTVEDIRCPNNVAPPEGRLGRK